MGTGGSSPARRKASSGVLLQALAISTSNSGLGFLCPENISEIAPVVFFVYLAKSACVMSNSFSHD